MAIVLTNVLVNGLSGMLGKTLMFKTVRGKTIVCRYTASQKKQTARQQANREQFKQAATWAKATMLNPVQKAYYQQRAKELKLPNGYTAAVQAYLREPMVR